MTAVAFVAIVAFVYGLLIGMQMCVPIAMWLNEVDMVEKMKEKGARLEFRPDRLPIGRRKDLSDEVRYLEWLSVFKDGKHVGNVWQNVEVPYFEPLRGTRLTADDMDELKPVLKGDVWR